jgi:hypothetical protein
MPLPPRERKRGEVSIAVAILRQRLSTSSSPRTSSPLSRSAGEGLGVRVPPHLPPSAHAASTKGVEEGRGKHSRGDPAPASVNVVKSTNQLPPLPQRGRGAGGEGRSLSTQSTHVQPEIGQPEHGRHRDYARQSDARPLARKRCVRRGCQPQPHGPAHRERRGLFHRER